ncbi:MAG: FKBP-type peptidyl-prolyl cis-trans isomerase [Wenzhouxiangellaceae bacterium]
MGFHVGRMAALSLCVGWSFAALATDLSSENSQLSYTIGMDIGNSLKQQGEEMDLQALFDGISDVYKDRETQMTIEEATAVRQAFMKRRQEQAQAERDELMQRNLEEGQEFLAKNLDKEGVKQTESGLQYKILEQGSGAKPLATDRVSVHYRGTLLNGTEFDSSYSRGQPATFPLNGVIPGWTEGLQLINEGGKMMLYIPSDLAYGERGAGASIGPNATLIFEVELLEVLKEDAAGNAASQ